MVLGSASVIAGALDSKIVLGRDVSTWRDIAHRFNEFIDLKSKGLWDVRIILFTADMTARDIVNFNVEAKLDSGTFAVRFSIYNSKCWVSSIDPVDLGNQGNWKQIGNLIEHLDELLQWLKEELA